MNYCASCGDEIEEGRETCADCGSSEDSDTTAADVLARLGEELSPDDSPEVSEQKVMQVMREVAPPDLVAALPESGKPERFGRYVVKDDVRLCRPDGETPEESSGAWQEIATFEEPEVARRCAALLNATHGTETFEVELGFLRFAMTMARALDVNDLTPLGRRKMQAIKTAVLIEESINTPSEIEERAKQDAQEAGVLKDTTTEPEE